MSSMRHVIATFLLGAFLLVQAPAEFFHTCAGVEESFACPDDGAAFTEHCPLCDHALPVFAEQDHLMLPLVHRMSCDLRVPLVNVREHSAVDASASRGPPLV